MFNLIRKKHPAPGWVVIPELGNGTGFQVNRHADAVAIGIWPSHGFTVHGYELKASRSDLIKELRDPSKADAIGKFCDYWWLAVDDIKLIDGLAIPETWGIVHRKDGILRTHRKAPKRKAEAWTRGFMAGAIRKVVEDWVPKDEYRKLKEDSKAELKAEVEREHKQKVTDVEHELRDLKNAVGVFEERSGVKITHGPEDGAYSEGRMQNAWQLSRIADAVKAVIAAREATGTQLRHDEPAEMVRQHIADVRRKADDYRHAAAGMDAGAARAELLLASLVPGGQANDEDGRPLCFMPPTE